jgi:hypothetical protein
MAIETCYTVPHSCGHNQYHDLSTRPPSERAGFARWLASTTCTECWRETKTEERRRQRDAAETATVAAENPS